MQERLSKTAACAALSMMIAGVALADGRLSATHTPQSVKTPTIAGDDSLPEADPGSSRFGQVYAFNVAGIESFDSLGDPSNTVINFDLASALGYASGTPLTLNGIGWNVNITAEGGSWLSEMVVYFDDTVAPDQVGLFLAPGINSGFPGTASFSSGVQKLGDFGFSDVYLPNGRVRMEFFESFDDADNVRDGVWNSGVLNIQVREVCNEPVWCYLDGVDTVIPSTLEQMRMYDVQPGDVLDVMEVCAQSACGYAARVEMFARPPFMEPAGHAKSHAGYPACIETKANDVVEGGFAEGTYWAKFRCVDLGNGNESILKIGYRYTDPGPDVDASAVCAEGESPANNDHFGDAMTFVAGDCVNDMGVGLTGALDTPIYINGDVDYLNVTGLTPGATYTVTVVDGMNSNGAYTDTMLGWFTGEHAIAAMDDNSGPLAGYSMLSFVADVAGAATLAVTGHGDSDFDGLMDVSMPYEDYGFGEYELLITLEAPPVEPLEVRADFNADGIVDTSDLSVMIEGFGAPAGATDLNNDGVVNTADLGMLLSVFGMTH
ncbi:MAG: hypothetical protein H6813_06480 [Phycisphaeraceae bacterium]|nr:hypothetical protein [Phycisphaeraceae bacterium]MCB9848118.1 hypothetical protein [Phycisphaeraceae bacterium]